jgi:hypothetical protein
MSLVENGNIPVIRTPVFGQQGREDSDALNDSSGHFDDAFVGCKGDSRE